MKRQHAIRYACGVAAAVLGLSVPAALDADQQQGGGSQQPQQQQPKQQQPQQQQPKQQQPQQQEPQQQQAQQQQQQGQPRKVDLDDLEDNPEKYIGQTVMVEGEVDRVLGPNLFTIDEKDWKDPEREMAVVVPDPFTAIVRSDAPVRVTGVVQKVPVAEIEKRRGFSGDAKIRAEIQESPVLVAQELTTVAPVAVNLRVRTDQPVGTSGVAPGAAPITDANQLATAKDTALVGRRVNLNNVQVTEADANGFWVRTPAGERIYVMTAKPTSVKEGQMAAVQGVILELPEGMRAQIKAPGEKIYIYADNVTAR